MATINEEARIPVYINDQQARSALKNLQNEADKWRNSMRQAMASGDIKGMKEAERELKKTNQQAAALRRSTFDVQSVLNNLSSASTKDIRTALKSVNKEMDGLNRNSKEYAAIQKKAQVLRTELNGVNNSIREQKNLWGKATDFVNRYWAVIGGGIALFASGKEIADEANDAFTGFEERVSNLSALTKLSGKNLEWLTDTAKETAGSTIEGNIRIGQTAAEIADAYTIVGSKRPELLKVKEDLAGVTQDAIILAAAAKGPLSDSVDGLTMSLNQFDLSADQSRRVINVLAAGSQEGAGNISYLTTAMEKSGTTANLMGVEIEQWAGAIESVAPYYSEASVAGNSFDKVLLKMKANNIGYVNGQFDLNTALKELENRFASGEAAVDIFGEEHAKMGELLVKNKDEVIRYTTAVTDSNVAIEQAAINTDNSAAKRAAAEARRNTALIELGEMLAPIYTSAAEASATAAEIMTGLVKVVADNKAVFLGLAGTIAAYTIAIQLANAESKARIVLAKTGAVAEKAWAVVTGLLTGKIKLAAIAQKAWNLIMSLNPIGLVVAAIGVLVTAIIWAWKKFDGFRGVVMGVWEVMKGLGDIIKTMVVDRFKEVLSGLGALGKAFMALINGEFANASKYALKGVKDLAGVGTKKAALEAGKKLGDRFKKGFEEGAKTKTEDVIPSDDGSSPNSGNKSEPGLLDGGGSAGSGSGSSSIIEDNKVKALEEANAKEKALLQRQHLEGKLSEDEYNAALLLAEISFLNDKLKLLKEGSQEYEDTLNEAMLKQAVIDSTMKNLMLQAEKELSTARIENMQDGLDKQQAFEMQRWEEEKAQLEQSLIDKKELSDQEMALNDSINQLKQEKEAAHQNKMRELRDTQHITDLQDRATAANPIDPNFATPEEQQAGFDARAALIEAEYARERKLAGDNQSALIAAERNYKKKMLELKLEQIDAEYAIVESRIGAAQSYLQALSGIVDEESALGRSLFLFNQALAIGEVWVNIAKANAKAIFLSPQTFGQPWVGVNTAQGLTQTAMIAAQTISKFSGKKEGGFTDKASTDDQVVDYVHSNEFVANANAVRNPTVKPILDLIDIAQKNGSIANLNLPAMLSQSGRRSGGYGAGSSSSANTPSSVAEYSLPPEVTSLIQNMHLTLTDIRNNGVKGVWDWDYDKKTRAKMQVISDDVHT